MTVPMTIHLLPGVSSWVSDIGLLHLYIVAVGVTQDD